MCCAAQIEAGNHAVQPVMFFGACPLQRSAQISLRPNVVQLPESPVAYPAGRGIVATDRLIVAIINR